MNGLARHVDYYISHGNGLPRRRVHVSPETDSPRPTAYWPTAIAAGRDPDIPYGHFPLGHIAPRTFPPPSLHGVGHFPLPPPPPPCTNVYKAIYR